MAKGSSGFHGSSALPEEHEFLGGCADVLESGLYELGCGF